MFRLPNLETKYPENGIAQNCPTGMVKRSPPSSASESPNAFFMSAIRVAQQEKPMPNKKKNTDAAMRFDNLFEIFAPQKFCLMQSSIFLTANKALFERQSQANFYEMCNIFSSCAFFLANTPKSSIYG